MNNTQMTMFDSDQVQHPMWTAPKPEDGLPDHVFALRRAIATALIPFDGASPERARIFNFCRIVYSDAMFKPGADQRPLTPEGYRTPIALMGWIAFRRLSHVKGLRAQLQGVMSPVMMITIQQDQKVITRLAEAFTLALWKEGDL